MLVNDEMSIAGHHLAAINWWLQLPHGIGALWPRLSCMVVLGMTPRHAKDMILWSDIGNERQLIYATSLSCIPESSNKASSLVDIS